jgi:hypothetical protein
MVSERYMVSNSCFYTKTTLTTIPFDAAWIKFLQLWTKHPQTVRLDQYINLF